MTDAHDLRKTPLYDLHVELGAKMVPFAGYAMPVQYSDGIIKEHLATRASAGLFDTSHMGQARLTGADPAKALEKLTPADVSALKCGRQRYALLLNDQGGIIDDFMVGRIDEHNLFLVVNAACKENDFAIIAERLKGEAELQVLPDLSLLALQGPEAVTALSRHVPEIAELSFQGFVSTLFDGIPVQISRSGYTGEDGFEISVANTEAETVARTLLAEPEVSPVGLGARDSLRLEAGLCLYGHDLNEDTDPASANLMWSVSKRRREARDFPAADKIMDYAAGSAPQVLAGLEIEGRALVRDGAELTLPDGTDVIGHVTSGGFAPSLGRPIAMGYVDRSCSQIGTKLAALVRGRKIPVQIAAMPFVPHRYFRGKGKTS